MSNCKEFVVHTKTKWKADGRDINIVDIFQTGELKDNLIKLIIPEFKRYE